MFPKVAVLITYGKTTFSELTISLQYYDKTSEKIDIFIRRVVHCAMIYLLCRYN
jgi:hypothetical protein